MRFKADIGQSNIGAEGDRLGTPAGEPFDPTAINTLAAWATLARPCVALLYLIASRCGSGEFGAVFEPGRAMGSASRDS